MEVTASKREVRSSNTRIIRTSWYNCVWAKVEDPSSGQRTVRLLEIGPEADTGDKALELYIEHRLGPAVSALADEHIKTTPMRKVQAEGHTVSGTVFVDQTSR